MSVTHTFLMAHTLHGGNTICLIIFMQKDLSFGVVTSGLTHVLDQKNLTKAQKVLFELDSDAYLFLMDALSFELFYKVKNRP
jgi:hypothetical protein